MKLSDLNQDKLKQLFPKDVWRYRFLENVEDGEAVYSQLLVIVGDGPDIVYGNVQIDLDGKTNPPVQETYERLLQLLRCDVDRYLIERVMGDGESVPPSA